MGITSHAAVIANIDMGPAVLPIGLIDSTIVFLPSAHITQRIALELLPMRMGTPVYFSESLSRLPAELKAIRPTFFLAPPRVWERMYATILSEVKKRPLVARKLFHGALGLGAEAARLQREGKPIPGWMKSTLQPGQQTGVSKSARTLGRTLADCRFRRCAAGQRFGGVLRGDWHAPHRRLRTNGSGNCQFQSARPPETRQHWQVAPRRGSDVWRTTANCNFAAPACLPATTTTKPLRGRWLTRMAGFPPATLPKPTPKATGTLRGARRN